jgi:hypothetical protein
LPAFTRTRSWFATRFSVHHEDWSPLGVLGGATNAGQLNFKFAALAKARIEWISRLICGSKAADVIGIGSMPCCASFSKYAQ